MIPHPLVTPESGVVAHPATLTKAFALIAAKLGLGLLALAIGAQLLAPQSAAAQAEQPYTVTAANSPSDGGKVEGQPSQSGSTDTIDCGTDCSAVVTNEPVGCDELGCADSWSIGLSAIPAEGYAFDYWEGCRSDGGGGAYDNSCYVNSSVGDVTVTAHWRKAECNDSTDNDGDGKTDYPDDPDCQSISDDTEAYAPPPDTTPPDITVTPASIGPTNDPTPTFEFSSTEQGVTFTCLIIDMSDAPVKTNYWVDNCVSPYTTPALKDGPWRIAIWAKDAAGNESPFERRDLTVDTTAPETSITSGPSDRSRGTSFAFSSSEPGTTFDCRLDGGAWSSCTSPEDYPALRQGSHTFEVAATDQAGNRDPTPATRSWEADTVAPTVTAISPLSGATGVSPQTEVFATFSEAVDPATITNTSFKLVRQGASAPESATVSYDASLKQAKLDPTNSLRKGARYTATVTTRVTDLVGNPVASDKTWSFTVGR
jgi:hypothetical protein